MALTGTVDGKRVIVALFDHSDNPGFPTYWMARPYGLFAANPLGHAAFDEEASPMDFTLGADEAATFRYRLLVRTGIWDPDAVDAAYEEFVETS